MKNNKSLVYCPHSECNMPNTRFIPTGYSMQTCDQCRRIFWTRRDYNGMVAVLKSMPNEVVETPSPKQKIINRILWGLLAFAGLYIAYHIWLWITTFK